MPLLNFDFKQFQKGMTLIELSIAILVLGVMLGGALQLYNQNREQRAQETTKERIDYITRALSSYAQTFNRIPCPADPSIQTARPGFTPAAGREPWRFGFEWGLSAQPNPGTRPSEGNCVTNDRWRGLVPYQTLNIPFEYTKDGWGNYFTYGVSPVFTQRTDFGDENTISSQGVSTGSNTATSLNDTTKTWAAFAAGFEVRITGGTGMGQVRSISSNTATSLTISSAWTVIPDTTSTYTISNARDVSDIVHERCRTAGWVMNGYPTNAPKARFCCAANIGGAFPSATTDIVIQNKDNSQIVTPVRDAYAATQYLGQIDEVVRTANQYRPATGNVEAAAFVLISHGKNGLCSFLANDTMNVRGACNHSGAEVENNDGDRSYINGVAQPQTAGGAFDDTVFWLSQNGLMSYNGGASCNQP